MSIPDRLYIDSNDRKIIDKIEKQGCFDFKRATNKEIFLLAMAIGVDANIDDYKIGKKDGFFLAKDLTPSDEALINICAIVKYGLDVLNDKEKVYNYVQNCAHVGFKILIDEIDECSFGSIDKLFKIKINDLYKNVNIA